MAKKSSYKNTLLILISLVLFAYSGLVLLYPAILNATFSKKKFCDQVYKTSALVTTIDKIDFKVTPKLDMIITFNGWESKHIDNQNAFESRRIQITTTPFAIFTQNYDIKAMEFRGTKIWEQILPSGENKLAYIAKCFSPKDFGVDKIVIKPSAADFDYFTIVHERIVKSKEEYYRHKTYSQYEVKTFLTKQNLMNVTVK